MNLETKITIYKFTPQVFTLTPDCYVDPENEQICIVMNKKEVHRDYDTPSLCDRDRIQTCNRLIRSQLLYSVELRDLYY